MMTMEEEVFLLLLLALTLPAYPLELISSAFQFI